MKNVSYMLVIIFSLIFALAGCSQSESKTVEERMEILDKQSRHRDTIGSVEYVVLKKIDDSAVSRVLVMRMRDGEMFTPLVFSSFSKGDKVTIKIMTYQYNEIDIYHDAWIAVPFSTK